MKLDNLVGQTFGIWEVLEFSHMKDYGGGHTLSFYKCRCSKCGQIFIKQRPNLISEQGLWHRGKCKR